MDKLIFRCYTASRQPFKSILKKNGSINPETPLFQPVVGIKTEQKQGRSMGLPGRINVSDYYVKEVGANSLPCVKSGWGINVAQIL